MRNVDSVEQIDIKKRHGIAWWLKLLIAIIVSVFIFIIVLLFNKIDTKKDFDRPWWQWTLLLLIFLILLLFVNGESIKGYVPKLPAMRLKGNAGNLLVNLFLVSLIVLAAVAVFVMLRHAFWEKRYVVVQKDTRAASSDSIPPKFDNFTSGKFCFKKGVTYTLTRGRYVDLKLTPETRKDCSTIVYLERVGYPNVYATVGFDSVGHTVPLAGNIDNVSRVKWSLRVSQNATMNVEP